MYEGLRELHLGVGAKWGVGPTRRWGFTYGRAGGGGDCPGIRLPWVEGFVARFEAGLGLLEEGHEALPPSSVPKRVARERSGAMGVRWEARARAYRERGRPIGVRRRTPGSGWVCWGGNGRCRNR
jgi:hypothetical protein